MTEREQKLKDFYWDKSNWKPPSLKQIANYLGISKSYAHKLVKQMYERNAVSQTNTGLLQIPEPVILAEPVGDDKNRTQSSNEIRPSG